MGLSGSCALVMRLYRAEPPESGFRFPKPANLYSSIATAHEAGQPIVSYVLKVVKVLPENARVGYKSCARSLQLPSSIAFDY